MTHSTINQSANIKGRDYTGSSWEGVAVDPTTKALMVKVDGAGYVTGDTSSVDGEIAVFDGTSGGAIRGSGVPMADFEVQTSKVT